MRALSAWLTFLGPAAAPVAPVALRCLARLALHRAPPDFLHLAFASMASTLKTKAEAQPETVVLPFIQQLWASQQEELLPYCLQIMALLLDLGAPAPLYAEMLPKLLAPELWQATLRSCFT